MVKFCGKFVDVDDDDDDNDDDDDDDYGNDGELLCRAGDDDSDDLKVCPELCLMMLYYIQDCSPGEISTFFPLISTSTETQLVEMSCLLH